MHNGKTYEAGERLPNMESDEKDRLLQLGVCAAVEDSSAAQPNGEAQTPPDPNQASGTPGAEQSGVDLNFSPDDALNAGAKKK